MQNVFTTGKLIAILLIICGGTFGLLSGYKIFVSVVNTRNFRTLLRKIEIRKKKRGRKRRDIKSVIDKKEKKKEKTSNRTNKTSRREGDK